MGTGKIIIVANQKGGVAKTSTVRNLAFSLAEMGKRVLAVDCDPQYNLTTSFGILQNQIEFNSGNLIMKLVDNESLPEKEQFIQSVGSVDVVPSGRNLTVTEANLMGIPDRNDYLSHLLAPLQKFYDYIIVDTNPALGALTINALTAAHEIIIPVDPELFALTGLQFLLNSIYTIKKRPNCKNKVTGILFTKCNKRTNLYQRTYKQVTESFQTVPIFRSQIPYTVKVGEANSYGMSVMELDKSNPAALAYQELAKEVLQNG